MVSFNQDPFLLVSGLILITICAIERFNTPPNKRYLTTAIRYYSISFVYVASYHMIYFILISRPEYSDLLLKLLNQGDLSLSGQVPIAMLCAIILSIFIPKLPYISKLDLKFRKLLHTLAAIPIKALQLSNELYQTKFVIDPKIKPKIMEYMRSKEINLRSFENLNVQSDEYIYLKISALMETMKKMEKDGTHYLFFKEREDYFNRLKKRYNRLSEMTSECIDIPKKMIESVEDESIRKSISGVYNGYKKQLETGYREVCNFVSQGVLKSQLNELGRAKFLNQIGFVGYKKKSKPFLNFHQIMLIYIILISLMLFYFIVITTQVTAIPQAAAKVLMIVTIYTASICAALYLKKSGGLFSHEEGGIFPIGGYVLTGLVAAICSIPITTLFNFTYYYFMNLDMASSWALTQGQFVTKYPWRLVAFMTGFATSFVCDLLVWLKTIQWLEKFRVVIAGLVEGILIGISGFITCWLLQGTVKQIEDIPNRVAVTTLTFIIGTIIGLLVPLWYEKTLEREKRSSVQHQDETETLADSEPETQRSERVILFKSGEAR